jgi:methionine sulfoxide reductase heme-binding subunit
MTFALTQAPSPLWYFARAAGFVSLVLLALTVALGIALTLRWRSAAWPTFISDGLHRYIGTVFLVFLAAHVATVLLDPFTKFSLADVLVPFKSSYRPIWMGLGICAAELALALALSVHVRRWIGYRAWRVIHYGTYATFPVAFLHGLGTGTDSHTLWGAAIYGACGLPIAGLALVRTLSGGTTGKEAAAGARPRRPQASKRPWAPARDLPGRSDSEASLSEF